MKPQGCLAVEVRLGGQVSVGVVAVGLDLAERQGALRVPAALVVLVARSVRVGVGLGNSESASEYRSLIA